LAYGSVVALVVANSLSSNIQTSSGHDLETAQLSPFPPFPPQSKPGDARLLKAKQLPAGKSALAAALGVSGKGSRKSRGRESKQGAPPSSDGLQAEGRNKRAGVNAQVGG